ncbi:MAG: radical SAM protein [Desulfosudaceae bacterium]
MLITLINPPALPAKYYYSSFSHPPLGLAYIAACLRQAGHSVDVIDAVGEDISRFSPYPASGKFMVQGLSFEAIINRISPETGLIGFSCMFTHAWPVARELINRTGRAFPGVPLLAGGEHPTALPEVCLEQACLTACVLGEGEQTMGEVATAIDNHPDLSTVSGLALKNQKTGQVFTTATRQPMTDLDALPWPAWDLIPWQQYRIYVGPVEARTMPMLATRGCPYQCAFCTARAMWGNTWRKRSPRSITSEMRHNLETYHISDFQFFDISSLIDRDWVRSLCQSILTEELSVKWHMPVGNRAEIIDDKTARLLKKSGFDYIQFAPESGSPRLLKEMRKQIDLNLFRQGVRAATGAGMRVSVLFIIGYPGETMADIRLTYQLIRRLARSGIHEIAISSFVLLPGTRVFRTFQKKGAVTLDDAFFYQAAGATDLGPARSWNPPFGSRKLMLLKWLGLLQFYGLSFLYYPRRPLRLLVNLRRGRQETKIDRVLREMIEKIKTRFGEPRHA